MGLEPPANHSRRFRLPYFHSPINICVRAAGILLLKLGEDHLPRFRWSFRGADAVEPLGADSLGKIPSFLVSFFPYQAAPPSSLPDLAASPSKPPATLNPPGSQPLLPFPPCRPHAAGPQPPTATPPLPPPAAPAKSPPAHTAAPPSNPPASCRPDRG
ncbi:hypothetical protein KSP40_PGU007600 [Platanthera guangdongensis]|uniref:Uncharacterized protein n=1 Tax=Platanthera guangdongensis TaxID=2320717 RepID=A0ABR2LGV6_9ASPA